MTLKDKGYRFCISPDKQRGRWISVIEHEKVYQDWSDHTDTPEKEFIEFLQSPVDVPSEQGYYLFQEGSKSNPQDRDRDNGKANLQRSF